MEEDKCLPWRFVLRCLCAPALDVRARCVRAPYFQRQQGLRLATCAGRRVVLQAAWPWVNAPYDVAYYASLNARKDLVEWILSRAPVHEGCRARWACAPVMRGAINRGESAWLEWCRAKCHAKPRRAKLSWPDELSDCARRGNLSGVLSAAARADDVSSPSLCYRGAAAEAACEGHLNVVLPLVRRVRSALRKGAEFQSVVAQEIRHFVDGLAATSLDYGHLRILRWMTARAGARIESYLVEWTAACVCDVELRRALSPYGPTVRWPSAIGREGAAAACLLFLVLRGQITLDFWVKTKIMRECLCGPMRTDPPIARLCCVRPLQRCFGTALAPLRGATTLENLRGKLYAAGNVMPSEL